MHDSLFLPRELFSPATALPAAEARPVRANRVAAMFSSGDAVAADLMNGVASMAERPSRERRRKPRSADAIGVDLHLGDRAG